jgi:hypothetical protein
MTAPAGAEGATLGDVDGLTEVLGTVAVPLSTRGGVRLVESAIAAGRRAPRLRNNGGATMTIAVNSNARKKRLSIDSDPEAYRL